MSRVDEVLLAVRQGFRLDEREADVLAAEVERLRAENADLKETHRLDGEALLKAESGLYLRDWFERREPLIERVVYPGIPTFGHERRALEEWNEANPKPGAGT